MSHTYNVRESEVEVSRQVRDLEEGEEGKVSAVPPLLFKYGGQCHSQEELCEPCWSEAFVIYSQLVEGSPVFVAPLHCSQYQLS